MLKGEDEEEGRDKGGEDKPVVIPLEDKTPVLKFYTGANLGQMRCF